jgi:acyl-CoA dehydrogenase
MTWVLDEQRGMLRDSAQSFFTERAPVAHLRALRDSRDATGYSPALWRALGAQGYSATLVPEAHGGLGLGVAEAGLIAEQIGHTLAPSPFVSTAVLSAWLLKTAGTAAQQSAWLPRIASADTVLALAVDEGSRHRPSVLATTAARDGGGWRLDGQKAFVVDGHVADGWIVAARADGGTALLLVPKGTGGVEVERTLMVDAHNAARLRFDGARVGCASTARASAPMRRSARSRTARRCWSAHSTSAARSPPASCSAWPTKCSSAPWNT